MFHLCVKNFCWGGGHIPNDMKYIITRNKISMLFWEMLPSFSLLPLPSFVSPSPLSNIIYSLPSIFHCNPLLSNFVLYPSFSIHHFFYPPTTNVRFSFSLMTFFASHFLMEFFLCLSIRDRSHWAFGCRTTCLSYLPINLSGSILLELDKLTRVWLFLSLLDCGAPQQLLTCFPSWSGYNSPLTDPWRGGSCWKLILHQQQQVLLRWCPCLCKLSGF